MYYLDFYLKGLIGIKYMALVLIQAQVLSFKGQTVPQNSTADTLKLVIKRIKPLTNTG